MIFYSIFFPFLMENFVSKEMLSTEKKLIRLEAALRFHFFIPPKAKTENFCMKMP